MTNQLKEALKAWVLAVGFRGSHELIDMIDAEPVTERPTDKQPGTPEFVLLPCPFCGVTPMPHQSPAGHVSCQNRKCAIEGQWMTLDKWRYRARIVVDGHVICEGTESLRGQWDKEECRPERPISDLYHELLYAVAHKFPNESRHQTALRYIIEREGYSPLGGSLPKSAPIK